MEWVPGFARHPPEAGNLVAEPRMSSMAIQRRWVGPKLARDLTRGTSLK